MSSNYLSDLVSGPVPPRSQWPPRLEPSSRQKAHNREVKAARNLNPVPMIPGGCQRTDTLQWAYKSLRFEAGIMVDRGIQIEDATLVDIARRAAAETGTQFADLARYILDEVGKLKSKQGKALVRTFSPLAQEPDDYLDSYIEEDPADIEELRRAADVSNARLLEEQEEAEIARSKARSEKRQARKAARDAEMVEAASRANLLPEPYSVGNPRIAVESVVPESPEVVEEGRRRGYRLTIADVGIPARRRRAEHYMRELASL